VSRMNKHDEDDGVEELLLSVKGHDNKVIKNSEYLEGRKKVLRPVRTQPSMSRLEALSKSRNIPQGTFVRKEYPKKFTKGWSKEKQHESTDRMSRPKSREQSQVPGQVYLPGKSRWDTPSGGRFSEAKPKSFIEWSVYLKKDMPGPLDYKINEYSLPKGGRFGDSKPLSSLDLEIMRAKLTPGPGEYGNGFSSLETKGCGRIAMSRGKTSLDWAILRAAELPGPGEYYNLHKDDSIVNSISGGKIGTHNPKSDLENTILRAKELPGPMDYYAERSYYGR